jgi:hypothetical protein
MNCSEADGQTVMHVWENGVLARGINHAYHFGFGVKMGF